MSYHISYHIISYILVMQCFRVRYRGICHASLVFSVYTRAFRRVCIQRKYKWQVACSTVSHEKALHNYFIPCLNLRKTYGNFGKSSEISANFRKLRKRFKPVFGKLNPILHGLFHAVLHWGGGGTKCTRPFSQKRIKLLQSNLVHWLIRPIPIN